MAELQQATVRNRLLKRLSTEDFARIRPHLHVVPAATGLMLIEADHAIEYLYFPEQGFASVTTRKATAGMIEVGMIGREGLVGAAPVILGVDRTPHAIFIQMPGEILRITTHALQAAVAQSPAFKALLLRYIQVALIQTAQTAFANAAFTIETRLARWLLMCHDRSEGDELLVTHEYLSMMLGVRRPGVSVIIQILEGNRLIKATRGNIRIVDRAGLKAVADDSYGLPEAEYIRLIESEV